MLAEYINQLYELFGRDHPARTQEEKDFIQQQVISRVLEETEIFIEESLPSENLKQKFRTKLDEVSENGDLEFMLTVVGRYLLEIPDVRYRLDQRMQAMIADVKVKLTGQNLQ